MEWRVVFFGYVDYLRIIRDYSADKYPRPNVAEPKGSDIRHERLRPLMLKAAVLWLRHPPQTHTLAEG